VIYIAPILGGVTAFLLLFGEQFAARIADRLDSKGDQ